MALLPQNQRDQMMVLLAIVGIAGAGIYWNFVWSPKHEDLETRQAHVDSLSALNDKVKREVASGAVTRLARQVDSYKAALNEMRTLVPSSNEVPQLLDQVSTAARRAGLEIGEVRPGAVVIGEHFDSYRYSLAVTGDYNAIGAFLSNIGSLGRIVAPMNLQLSSSGAGIPTDRKKGTKSFLVARFDIQTYASHGGAPAAPPTRPPGAAGAPAAGGVE